MKLYPSVLARARARNMKRALNVSKCAIVTLGVPVPKNWKDMNEAEQLEWARDRLRELAVSGSDSKGGDGPAVSAAAALARSLEASVLANRPDPNKGSSPTQPKSRAYLEAVRAECEAELGELDKKAH